MRDKTIRDLIADRLKEARKQSGMTQSEVGDILDMTGGGYSLYESKRSSINPDDLFACSIMFGVPIQDLFPDPHEIPQAFRLIHEQKRREKNEKRKKELLAELERIEKELEE